MTNELMTKVFLAAVRSPLLSGAGEGSGIADISLQRDSICEFPKIDGSVWKGAIAKSCSFLWREISTYPFLISDCCFSSTIRGESIYHDNMSILFESVYSGYGLVRHLKFGL